MLDRIEDGGETYATFDFAEKQKGGVTALILKDKDGREVFKVTPKNDYTVFIYSGAELKEGTYSLWSDEVQLAGAKAMMFGRPEEKRPERPDNFDPEKMKPDFDPSKMPEGFEPGEMPDRKGAPPKRPDGRGVKPDFSSKANPNIEISTDFIIEKGGNMFSAVKKAS